MKTDLLLWYVEQFVEGNYTGADLVLALQVNLECSERVAAETARRLVAAYAAGPTLAQIEAKHAYAAVGL